MKKQDFTPAQKRYLEGFMSGVQIARNGKGASPVRGVEVSSAPSAEKTPPPGGPDSDHRNAQTRALAEGKKLAAEEVAKQRENPLDIYARMKQAAKNGEYPKGVDIFRWKTHGLFYVAPAQDSFMCRLRIPNGILTHWQFRGVAELAATLGGGYAHVTTRANLQVREIGAENGIGFIEGLQDLGLTAKGAGADNIRNVTGSPTAGIDPQELFDTRSMARAWHHHILNDRSLYGLPRKFNVGFDGGGTVPVLEDTNDIGFQAVRLRSTGDVMFRLAIGGITGHEDFARDTGIAVSPDETVEVADAVVRVFIDHGDRTNRRKARLKYLLDDWGFETYLAAVEEKLGRALTRVPLEDCEPRREQDRQAHLGIHRQRQDGLSYIGVVLPVGRMTVAQMNQLADIARDLGDGDLRLTVWQNLLISGIPDDLVDEAKSRIESCGLDWGARAIRAGLVACTGNTGCRFAASDTKAHAEAIARHCEGLALDTPVNIHLTGCHHSCAQHYIGDIGLLGVRVAVDGEGEETVDGYKIYVGGGFGSNAGIGREIFPDIPAEETPQIIERLLKVYLAHRKGPDDSFHAFTNRHEIDALRKLTEVES